MHGGLFRVAFCGLSVFLAVTVPKFTRKKSYLLKYLVYWYRIWTWVTYILSEKVRVIFRKISKFYEGGWDPLKVNWFDEQSHLVGLSNFGTP